MQSKIPNSVIIRSLEPFMNKKYFETFFYNKASKLKVKNIDIVNRNNLPYKALIVFSDEKSKTSFIEDWNNKNYPDLNLKFDIKETDTSEKIDEIDKERIFTFPEKYEDHVGLKYEKVQKEEGLIFKDEKIIKEQNKVISYLIKKIGNNLLKGESIMNISLPVTIFDTRSLMQVLAYEQVFAPIFLNRAFYSSNNIERLKWVTTFMISQMYLSPMQTKPFNPIIGETYQIQIGEDLELYFEQVAHKPPTCAFYGTSKNYNIFGNLSVEAKTGANSLKATKHGTFKITFPDGGEYELKLAEVRIGNLNVGKRQFNFKKSCVCYDNKNNLASVITINPEKKTGITGLFSSAPKVFPDYFKGSIVNLSDIEFKKDQKHIIKKNAKVYSEIEGEWTTFLKFDGINYWTNGDVSFPLFYKQNFVLPSDSIKREDLNALINGDIELSQKKKEEYEEIQRKDAALRSNYLKNLKAKK